MSATNLLPHKTRAAVLPIVFIASTICIGEAMAQGGPAVTDADIARIQRSQPVLTDQDLERARKKYRMPTEQELSRVPVPAAPNVDALPRPEASRPVDLEALAKGYNAHAEPLHAAQGLSAGPSLMIFVSFSMPHPTLQRLVEQAAQSHASLVMRGFVNGSLHETVARVQSLIGNRQVAFQIDPQAFDRFSVSKTPTFVLVRAGAQGQQCASGLCLPPDAFVAASGDVSLDYALEFIERTAPRFASDARAILQKIKG